MTNVGKNVRKVEALYTVRNLKRCSIYGKHYGVLSKTRKLETPYDLTISLLDT
jgi:hypothetical protein